MPDMKGELFICGDDCAGAGGPWEKSESYRMKGGRGAL
jgi:hypothetical protein